MRRASSAARLSRLQARSITSAQLAPLDRFQPRHIGIDEYDEREMLEDLGYKSMQEFLAAVIPSGVGFEKTQKIDGLSEGGLNEFDALNSLRSIASLNDFHVQSLLGQGFYDTKTPAVIKRHMLENAGWYTAYTPYQSEISQGRMEMMLNFQTMIADLTGMAVANASLLDEASAAAEALNMSQHLSHNKEGGYFIDRDVHPSTLSVVLTRSQILGRQVHVGDPKKFDFEKHKVSGALLQYPHSDGVVPLDMEALIARAKLSQATVVVACDLLALTLLQSPGLLGADLAVGTSQRFGVPLSYGGPHAAFLACKDVKTARRMPGRIMAVSRDRERGEPAIRMALQTREQHIRREKATSNICTAQALLANMAAAYGVYHGPHGLRGIAERVHGLAYVFHTAIRAAGGSTVSPVYFDTVSFRMPDKSAPQLVRMALEAGFNIRQLTRHTVSVAFDETVTLNAVQKLLVALTGSRGVLPPGVGPLSPTGSHAFLRRTTPYMTHEVFNSYTSETAMTRYLYRLQSKDFSLIHGMIPLGSCTMKLNASIELIPVSWPMFANIHPFVPDTQARGYKKMISDLESMLASLTGFDACSLQPNSGSQGEYSGLRAIQAYQHSVGQSQRNQVLIPESAHGTNPASTMMAGLKPLTIKCLATGYIDLHHLDEMIAQHGDTICAIMITYPSTYGLFEETVRTVIDRVHACGGQVYMDGANMNAQVGLTSPGFLGADVCHLNLHKTFAIPHGGGGPGVGPICVRKHLKPFLPGNPLDKDWLPPGKVGPVTSTRYGSAGILPIPWMYLKMMGRAGLQRASSTAMLSANYMRTKLKDHYPVHLEGHSGHVAHEFILDLNSFNKYGVRAEDVAKRLMDYGFHAPTVSWPVAEALMIEPTESENKAELDRFIGALIAIRAEIQDIIDGKIEAKDSPLHRAPHTLRDLTTDKWERPYSRKVAAYPMEYQSRGHKFWPTVNRVDQVWGDRHLFPNASGWDAVKQLKD